MLDTLQLAKDLEKDFPPAQAEALTRALSSILAADLATKSDLEALKADIKTLGADLRAEIVQLELKLMGEIGDVRGEIGSVRGEIGGVRGEIKDVRGEIKDLKVDIVRWIVGALLVNFFGVAGLMITLIKVIH